MKHLRKTYTHVEKTEHWNMFARRKNDFLGVCDIFATDGKILLAVQTTSASNLSARLKKARLSSPLKLWLQAGGCFVIHTWKKVGSRWQIKETYL